MEDGSTPAPLTPTASRKISVVVGGSSPGLRSSSPTPLSSPSPGPGNKRKRKITIKLPGMSALAASSVPSSSPSLSSTPSSFIPLSSSLSSPSPSPLRHSPTPSSDSRDSAFTAVSTTLSPLLASSPSRPRTTSSSSSSSTSSSSTSTSQSMQAPSSPLDASSPTASPSLSSSSSALPSPSLLGGSDASTKEVVRVKGALVERPIIYGNISWWLGKKADETKTHRWTTYVRGPHNEDLSYFIKKVVFTLHPSFPNPVRVIEQPPYEVTEQGWGEFELTIRIHFVDPLEVPVDLVHALVLYPPEGNLGLSTKKPVIKEIYDEIEFHDPTEHFYKVLKENEMMSVGSSPHPLAISRGRATETTQSEGERKELDELAKARSKIREEIIKIRDAYDRYDVQGRHLREDIKELTDLAEEEYKKRHKLTHPQRS